MRRWAFTLVELLVVIAIIAVMASILFPALSRSLRRAKGTVDVSNMHQVFVALTLYEGDNGDRDPRYLPEALVYFGTPKIIDSPLDQWRKPEADGSWTEAPLVPCGGPLSKTKVSYPYLRTFLEIDGPIPEDRWAAIRSDPRVGIIASPWMGEVIRFPGPGGWCGQSILDVTGPQIEGPIQRVNMDGSLFVLPRSTPGFYGGSYDDLFLRR